MNETKETTEEVTLTDFDRKRFALERLINGAMDVLADHRDVSLLLYIKINNRVIQASSEDFEEIYQDLTKPKFHSQSTPQ